MDGLQKLRAWAGVTLFDAPRYGAALYSPWRRRDAWVRLCNRIDRLTEHAAGRGVLCNSAWGSELHAPIFYPSWATRLMNVALHEWPVRFADAPARTSGPKVSFLFAHAGHDRLRHLITSIKSIFAQRDVEIECVVADQSATSIEPFLPRGVVFVRLDKRDREDGWHKSWAFNVAARKASGDILIFHDGDICAPERYASEVVRTIREEQYDAVSLQRFLFYVDESSTQRIAMMNAIPSDLRVLKAFQNWKGGTIAVQRKAFFEIGGFDEGFVDWGGEDDEFYDRCGLLRHWRYGYMPFIHLWHPPQSLARDPRNPNTTRVVPERLAIPADVRRRELCARRFGELTGPDPCVSYRSRIRS